MPAAITQLSHLLNPLATPSQLETSASQLDGVPSHVEDSIRFQSARLTQAAGILLRLPQELIAQAIVLLFRFWVGPDAGSLLEHDAQDIAAATLYLAAKPSAHAVSPRHVLTVFTFLSRLSPRDLTTTTPFSDADSQQSSLKSVLATFSLPESTYQTLRSRLYAHETLILQTLGFQTHVALPHPLCLTYLQTLDCFSPSSSSSSSSAVAHRALAHLNAALLSPQLLYLTHQPAALATAAVYLAAREVGVKLPETEWWEIFDVEREELGFLVVALRSLAPWAEVEREKWGEAGAAPTTAEGLRRVLERDGGEAMGINP